MFRLLSLVCALVLLTSMPGEAQVLGTGVTPTVEVGPMAAEVAATAVTSATTAANSTLSVANQLKELLPLDVIIATENLFETLAALNALAVESQQVGYDLQTVQAQLATLFNLDTAPSTPAGLTLRLAEIRTVKMQALGYALKVQSLLDSIAMTADHLRQLITTIAGLVGQKQAMQVLIQTNTSMHVQLNILQMTTASYYRTRTIDAMEREVIKVSWAKIQCDVWADWPGWSGCMEVGP